MSRCIAIILLIASAAVGRPRAPEISVDELRPVL